MLLVDHDRAERGEVHPLLDEGVGADGDVDLAGGQPGEDPPAVGRTHLVGQQLEPDRPGTEQRRARVGHLDVGQQGPDAERVLLGEDLGRRHEGPLVPALHGGEQRPDGDDRLSSADIALQQPVHRVGGRQVLPDLGDGGALVGGEVERQAVEERVKQRALGHVGDAAGRALDVALALDQGELDP